MELTPEGKAQVLSFLACPEKYDAKIELVRGHTGYAANHNLHQISLRMVFNGSDGFTHQQKIKSSKKQADRIFKLIEEANKIT